MDPPLETMPTIEVLSRARATRRLLSRSEGAKVDCLVSIGGPEQRLPRGFHRPPFRLRLLFHDVMEDAAFFVAPCEEDVARLIRFARPHAGTARRFIVHCEAGISRSTASAIILYAVWLGAGREDEAVSRVYECVPQAAPNPTLVRLADAQLGREGALIAAVERRMGTEAWNLR